jgi:hypothetical protein
MSPAQREEVLRAAGKMPSDPITAPDGSSHKRADAVIQRLERVHWWVSSTPQESAALPYSQVEKRHHAIAVAADQLLDALQVPAYQDEAELESQIAFPLRAIIEEHSYADGDTRLYDAIESVALLRDAAREAEAVAGANKGRSADHAARLRAELIGMSPETIDPTDQALGAILGIWTGILGRKIQISFDPKNQRPSGPLIRFASACLESLGLQTTKEAIRARVRRMAAGRREKS